MEQVGGSMLKWRLTLAETLSFGVSVALATGGITIWSMTTFQSKTDASELRQQFEHRVNSLEEELKAIRGNMGQIAVDVSYIRGKLEPRTK